MEKKIVSTLKWCNESMCVFKHSVFLLKSAILKFKQWLILITKQSHHPGNNVWWYADPHDAHQEGERIQPPPCPAIRNGHPQADLHRECENPPTSSPKPFWSHTHTRLFCK